MRKLISRIDGVGMVLDVIDGMYSKGEIDNIVAVIKGKDGNITTVYDCNMNNFECIGLLTMGKEQVKEAVFENLEQF